MPKPNYKDYLFVGLQFLLLLAYLFPVKITSFNFPDWLQKSGIALLVVGTIPILMALGQLNTKLSPFPTPKSDGKLITNGIFSISRHPIYTGILISFFGFAIHSATLYKFLMWTLLLMLFYFKSSYEEQQLKKFYHNYTDYQQKTRRFL